MEARGSDSCGEMSKEAPEPLGLQKEKGEGEVPGVDSEEDSEEGGASLRLSSPHPHPGKHKAVNANANEKGGKKRSRLQKIRQHYVAGSGWQWQAVTDDGEPVLLTLDFISPYLKMSLVAACNELGVCNRTLTLAVRTLGIVKWPYRAWGRRCERCRRTIMGKICRKACGGGSAAAHAERALQDPINTQQSPMPACLPQSPLPPLLPQSPQPLEATPQPLEARPQSPRLALVRQTVAACLHKIQLEEAEEALWKPEPSEEALWNPKPMGLGFRHTQAASSPPQWYVDAQGVRKRMQAHHSNAVREHQQHMADEEQRLAKEQDELARRAQNRQAKLQREQEELERKERELAQIPQHRQLLWQQEQLQRQQLKHLQDLELENLKHLQHLQVLVRHPLF